jgi:hypothetical protein
MACRHLAELLGRHEGLAKDHADHAADTAAGLTAVRETADARHAGVERDLARLGRTAEVLDAVDVRALASRVHALSRQFDESDVFVQHLRRKVRGRGEARGGSDACMTGALLPPRGVWRQRRMHDRRVAAAAGCVVAAMWV